MDWQSLENHPSLPLRLIARTVLGESVYLEGDSSLSLPITKNISSGSSQEIGLKLIGANPPITVITGVGGSGKTRLGKILAGTFLEHHRKILILSHHRETLNEYRTLSPPPYPIGEENYGDWCKRQVREKYLNNLSIDLSPLYLLPDELIERLSATPKLERWLSNPRLSELKNLLPDIHPRRLKLLFWQLNRLSPILKQQLALQQKTAGLSEKSLEGLAGSIVFPRMGTVKDFLRYREKETFERIIVEEAEYLDWQEIVTLAAITRQLILLGSPPIDSSPLPREEFSTSTPFYWLGEYLLPSYRHVLLEQFRLHPTLAEIVFPELYGEWIDTPYRKFSIQVQHRLIWRDIRGESVGGVNVIEGKKVLEILGEWLYLPLENIGILAFTASQRDWLRDNCSLEEIFIGTFPDWVGVEKRIVLISCVGEGARGRDLAIALTRVKDCLIFCGDYSYWSSRPSLLQSILSRRELHRDREVVLESGN